MPFEPSKRMMRATAALAPVLFFGVTAAAAPKVQIGDRVGVDFAEISAHFTERGYQLRGIEKESEAIEVEAEAAGVSYEFELSVDQGLVTKIERDDD